MIDSVAVTAVTRYLARAAAPSGAQLSVDAPSERDITAFSSYVLGQGCTR
jgi:hypothetical protein